MKAGVKPGGRPSRVYRPDDYDGPTWIYGHHAVLELINNPRRRWDRLIATGNGARLLPPGLAHEALEPRAIDHILPSEAVHQGLAVLAHPLDPPPAEELFAAAAREGAPLVFLDQVTDPHNVGAILRSAAAFGAAAVVTTRRHSPPVTGVLAKSASGALEHVHYLRDQNLATSIEAAKAAGYRIIGLDETGEALAPPLPAGALGIVLGAEGPGLREKTRSLCDELRRLETAGRFGTLNVSNAAAVALYALSLPRR